MKTKMTKTQAIEQLQNRYKKAEDLLKDDAKMEPFLEKLEKKIKWIPFVSQEIKSIPILISMVRSYWKGEYKTVPIKSIIAIVSALIYFLSPLDVVPDWIPFLGQMDDALVIATVWKQVHKDIEAYREWKNKV
ncbi:YkvA family protein [Streptococcus entericus]|uniref:YkvA family protein n=1 Tax=Streptococcus entericus TaxID=155680 RepID=UPI00035D6254|nr:YkvA family protein [Streptococcus entericus]